MDGFDVTDLPLTDCDLGGRSLATTHATKPKTQPLSELEIHCLTMALHVGGCDITDLPLTDIHFHIFSSGKPKLIFL